VRLFERTQRQAEHRAADLHDDPRIGQRRAAFGGKADCTLAANQQAFDLAIVLDRHRERDEGGTAGEVDDSDTIAGMMQDVVRSEIDRLQMRGKQVEIVGVEPLKEFVLGPAGHARSLACRESAPGEPYVSL
jgi:hypothetical protein